MMNNSLTEICCSSAKKKYGDPLPAPVSERLEQELCAVRAAGSEQNIMNCVAGAEASKDAGSTFGRITGGSIIAFLLGLTETDPLPPYGRCPACGRIEFVDRPEFPSGLDLNTYGLIPYACGKCGTPIKGNGTDIPFEFSPIRKAAEWEYMVQKDRRQDALRGEVDLLKKKAGIAEQDIILLDVDIFDYFLDGDLRYLTSQPDKMREIADSIFPMTFSDVVNVCALLHGTGTWEGNGEELIGYSCSQYEMITTAEDMMLNLVSHGIERHDAFEIARKVRNGKGSRLSDAEREMLLSHDIPEWYVGSMAKIRYLFAKGHLVNEAMQMLKVVWGRQHVFLEDEKVHITNFCCKPFNYFSS